MTENKQKHFQTLVKAAGGCRKCPELRDRTAFLSHLNGALDPLVMFVAEAPGRVGTVQERQPFSDSKSGATFQKLLDSINLSRDQIFITNAALCNPQAASGANRKPTGTEVKNCSDFLLQTVKIINPKIIATLGAVGLEALKAIEYHQFTLRNDAAKILDWNSRLLVPLYHPSPQVTCSHRREHEQIVDFQSLARTIERFEN